jgi:hypothetical protein
MNMICLSEWERGFYFAPSSHKELRMYLWFYEWNLFEAFRKGQHTAGNHFPTKELSADQRNGVLKHPGLHLEVMAKDDGADLVLTVTNETSHDWPSIAAIIPCFSPGESKVVPPTEVFFDEAHERTWYLGNDGLVRLVKRDIHFNSRFRNEIDAEARDGEYVFSQKWPTSQVDAIAGLLLRESMDKKWIAGIAWEDFISVQGHNPWRCMHQSVRVGPLKPAERKKIRGRIYLFEGAKKECLRKFSEDFNLEHITHDWPCCF